MKITEFVHAIKIQTSDAAVKGVIRCLTNPPGRKPNEHLLQLSEWYNQMDDQDQSMLRKAIREAAEMAVFEFFCVLDGVSVIEDTPEKGELVLHYTKGTEKLLLNNPRGEELHNLFNALCGEDTHSSGNISQLSPYDSGKTEELRSKMISGDDLDIHHVPDKYSSMQNIKGYDPQKASAIVLPKLEHRQIPPS